MEYAAFANVVGSRGRYIDLDAEWAVISREYVGDRVWYVEIPNAGSQESAMRTAEALKEIERKKRENENSTY